VTDEDEEKTQLQRASNTLSSLSDLTPEDFRSMGIADVTALCFTAQLAAAQALIAIGEALQPPEPNPLQKELDQLDAATLRIRLRTVRSLLARSGADPSKINDALDVIDAALRAE
jgi:hypothetical protein